MSYTSVFGGTTIYPSDVSYLPLALAADTTLEWPLEASGDVTVAARIIGVTPASAGRSVIMPDATRTGPGQSVLFNNMSGTYSFLVKDDGGTTLATVTPGTQWQIYLTDNATAAGTWEVYQMGASTATVQASALAGPGLTVVGAQLAQAAPFSEFTEDLSPSPTNRATTYVYTGSGAATVTLPTAPQVDSTYFIRIRNQGDGVLLITPAGTDLVNGAPSLNLAPEDSAMFIFDGASEWYTVGLGQNAEFTFDYVSIEVSGGVFVLSSNPSNLNRIAYRFTGTLTSNAVIVVPETVQQYWVNNQTSGPFTLGLQTPSQANPTLVNQNASAILYSDGTEVVLADTSSIAIPVTVNQGGTGSTTASGARANLGISPYADPLVTAANAPAAQAVLFPAPITDGQMLIGNAATPGFAQTTLTAGTGINVLNGPGTVTIVNTGSPAPGSVYSQRFSGTGAQTAFTLSYQPYTEENTQVYINGVYQQKDTYSLSGFVITFSVAPPLGTNNIEVVVIQVVPIGATNADLVNTTLGISQQDIDDSLIMMAPWIGAAGDGVTNDRTVINTYLATNTRLHFPARIGLQPTSRYAINGVLLIKQSGTHISFDAGARLVGLGGVNPGGGLRVDGTAPTSYTNLSANAAEGQNQIVLAADPGWDVGDWVEILSEAVITGCPNEYGNKVGCLRKITKKTVSGSVTFDLNKALPYSFLTADTAKAGKAGVIENVIIDCAQINDEDFGTNLFSFPIYLNYAAYVTLINPRAFGSKLPHVPSVDPTGDFIKMVNCFDVEIRNPFMRHGGYYGISISGMCEDIRSYGGAMEDVRHGVSVVWLTSGPLYGQPINVLIDGMVSSYTTLSAFDTHDTGRDIRFVNCVAEGAGDDGFQARTTGVSFDQCVARNSLRDGFSQGQGASGLRAVNCVSVENGRIGVNWSFDTSYWIGGRVALNGSPNNPSGLVQSGGGPGFVMKGGLISGTEIEDNGGTAAIVHGQVRTTFTGDISGTTLTISAPVGTVTIGDTVMSTAGTAVTAGTTIVSQISGTPLGAGTYQVSVSQTVASTTMVAGSGQEGLLVEGCNAPPSATQDTLAGVPSAYNFGLLTLRNNEIAGYGDTMFASSTATIRNIAPVTSGNQIARSGANRTGVVTLSGGLATVANTAIRDKAAAAFFEAIACSVDLKRIAVGGVPGALYIDNIVDQQQFTIKSTNFVEPTRTNVVRNNTNVGVVNGLLPAPGVLPTNWSINALSGLAMTVVGTGTETGPGGGTQNYIDIQLAGTATATNNVVLAFDTSTNPAAAASAGQTWTSSFGAKVLPVGTQMTGISPFINLLSYTGGAVVVDSFFTSINIGGTAVRYARTATLTGAAAFARAAMQFTVANGNTVDATVRVYMPQLEQADNASAPIATTNPAALTGTTRTADTLNADNSTLIWEMSL